MKNNFNVSILGFLLTFIMVSCENFLETKPINFLTPSIAYNTEDQLEAALAGVYDALGGANATKGIYSDAMVTYGAIEGDLTFYTSTNPSDGPQIYDFSTSNRFVEYYWNALYFGIDRANMLLANIDNNPDVDEEVRSVIRGEAIFLRGYYYFLLVQTFGEVPLKLVPSVSASHTDDIPKSSIKEVYSQILSDMKKSEPLVMGIGDVKFGGRLNKSAVRGIIARTHLYMAGYPLYETSNYDSVLVWTKKVIDDPIFKHELNPDFSKIFINYARDEYDIKESIWEVEFYGNRTGAYDETGIIGVSNGPPCGNIETGMAIGIFKVTRKFYELYQPWDLRKGWSIVNFTYNTTGTNGSKTFRSLPSGVSIYNHNIGKFRREYEVLTPKAVYRSPINFPILRFADVLLMFAEAENEVNGPTQAAIDAVNAVRKRSFSAGVESITLTSGGSGYTTTPTVVFSGGGGSGAKATAHISGGKVNSIQLDLDDVTWLATGKNYSSAPFVLITGGGGSGASATTTIYSFDDAKLSSLETSSKVEFRKMIQIERARELSSEGLRKWDLIRWGIFVETMQDVGAQIDIDFASSGGILFSVGFKNVTSKHLLWPIPERELTLNKSLIQNEKW
jgi:hypothetical protein